MADASKSVLSRRLKLLRSHLGWSIRRLEEESGVHNSTISQIETGRRGARTGTVSKLANALGVTTDYLLGNTDTVDGRDPITGESLRRAHVSSSDSKKLKQVAREITEVYGERPVQAVGEALEVISRISKLIDQKEAIDREIQSLIKQAEAATGWRLDLDDEGHIIGVSIEMQRK